MKIIYIHQYFKTPQEGGPIRSYYLAKGLVENGYEVEMITSYNGWRPITKNVEGIKVHYLPIYYANRLGFFRRIFAFLKFMYMAYRKALKVKDADICYATSTPLTVGLIAMQLKRKTGIPYYFEVRDLWPEAPIQMGAVNNYFLKQLLYYMERKIYQGAEKIITLSPGIRQGVEEVAPDKATSLIPNMSDCKFFQREKKDPSLVHQYGVANKFVITYFGAVGKVNRLEYMLDIVEICKDAFRNIHFFIAGEGAELDKIKQVALEKNLHNLSFPGYLNKDELKGLLNVTDATFISFDKKKILETNSPNKFFDSLAAGKLCIVNTDGWVRHLVEQNRCGFYVDPDRPEKFIDMITPFLDDANQLNEYQYNARNLAEVYFSRELQVKKLIRVINKEEQLKPIEPSVYILTA